MIGISIQQMSSIFKSRDLFIIIVGLISFLLGSTVILGWILDIPSVVQILPTFTPMQFNTALCFILAGIMLIFLCLNNPLVSRLSGLILLFFGLVTIFQYVSGLNVGIDQIFMEHQITTGTSHPGRMAPNTALCFTILGISGLFLSAPIKKRIREIGGQIFGVLTLALSTIAGMGYLLELKVAYAWGSLTGMAFHTSLGIVILSIGMVSYAASFYKSELTKVPVWLVGALFLFVLHLDLSTPLGIAMGFAYAPLMFCALWFLPRYAPLILFLFASTLILLTLLASPGNMPLTSTIITNRVLSIIVVGLTAIMVFMYITASRKLVRTTTGLNLSVESGEVGLWDWHITSDEVNFSDQWWRMLGYSYNELEPSIDTWEKLIHPDDLKSAKQSIDDYLSGHTHKYETEFRMLHKDGTWRWVLARGKVVERNSKRENLRFTGVHLDISERKKSEEMLMLLRGAIENSDSMVLVTTPDPENPQVIYASDTSLEITGYTPDELMGKNPKIFQGDRANSHNDKVLVKLRRALKNYTFFEGDLINYSKSGREYYIKLHIFPIKNSSDKITHFGSIGYDVSEKYRMEMELNQERDKFRLAMENSPIGIALVSIDGRWLEVNKALCNIVGYDREELLVSDFIAITHPDDLDLDLELLNQLLSREKDTYEMEKRYIHKNGNIIWVMLSVSLVWNEDETPKYFISQIQDITVRKKSEEKLTHYTFELEKSNQELDDFAYIASHDLKEPLRAINNHSQALQKKYSDILDERGQYKLGRLVNQSEKMEKLISDLLYYSRLGREKQKIQKVDMELLIKEQIEILSPMIKDKNARVELLGDFPELICNVSSVATIFRNIITNGIKYNENDQKIVKISYDRYFEKDGEILVNVFHINDNGIGIEPEFHEDIFRMFKCLNSEKVYGPGTGAGLAFVKKSLDQLGGQIWLTSTLGKGSTFHFSLGDTPNNET